MEVSRTSTPAGERTVRKTVNRFQDSASQRSAAVSGMAAQSVEASGPLVRAMVQGFTSRDIFASIMQVHQHKLGGIYDVCMSTQLEHYYVGPM